jgi:hypothetical protein
VDRLSGWWVAERRAAARAKGRKQRAVAVRRVLVRVVRVFAFVVRAWRGGEGGDVSWVIMVGWVGGLTLVVRALKVAVWWVRDSDREWRSRMSFSMVLSRARVLSLLTSK